VEGDAIDRLDRAVILDEFARLDHCIHSGTRVTQGAGDLGVDDHVRVSHLVVDALFVRVGRHEQP
jgi:hypothetical protein